jgi:hypothetical protein
MVDLTAHPPRRWSDKLAGYVWLPRLVDKVRAFQSGNLGAYAYPSFLDRVFLKYCHLTPVLIEQAVRENTSDEAIGTFVRRHTSHTQEQIAALNRQFKRRWGLALRTLDCDDGYMKGLSYPIPRFLQPFVWRLYRKWAAGKVSATKL